MALTYASNIAASSQGAFAIFPVTDSVGGAAFDILQADISTGVVSAVSSAVPLSSLQTGVLTEILQALKTATSGITDALPYFRKLAGVLTTQDGDSVAVSAVNVAGSTWKMQATVSGPGTALVYIPNSAAAGIYTGAGSDNGAVPFGPAGGVLGYTGSTYPNPNGLAAVSNVIPILRGSGASPSAITIRPDQALTTGAGTPVVFKAADAGPGATTADGGKLTLQGGIGGTASGGEGGAVEIAGGSGNQGGSAFIKGGVGSTISGDVEVTGGAAANGSVGVAPSRPGSVYLRTGAAGTTVNTAYSGLAPEIVIEVQQVASGATGGAVSLTAGQGGDGDSGDTIQAGDGGNMTLRAGNGGDGSGAGYNPGDGGDLSLLAGDAGALGGATGAPGGDLNIDAGGGAGTGLNGVINVGATVARTIGMGRLTSNIVSFGRRIDINDGGAVGAGAVIPTSNSSFYVGVAAGAVTLNGTTPFGAPSFVGQYFTLVNGGNGGNTITVPAGGNVKLAGGANAVLDQNGSITCVCTKVGIWAEMSRVTTPT